MCQSKFITSFIFLGYSLIILNILVEVSGRQNFLQKHTKLQTSQGYDYRDGLQDFSSHQLQRQQQVVPHIDTLVLIVDLTPIPNLAIFISCNLLHYGNWTQITRLSNSFTQHSLMEINETNRTVLNPWMSCRFVRFYQQPGHSNLIKEWTPPQTPSEPFDPYLNFTLAAARGESITVMLLDDFGISNGLHNHLSRWGDTNSSKISTDPGFKLMNSVNGSNCNSICAIMTESEPECMAGFSDEYQRCIPRDDYDIKKYGVNRILSTFGIPCVTECKWLTEPGQNGYGCTIRPFKVGWLSKIQYCSPSAGQSYLGQRCTSACGFRGGHVMTCFVANSSRPQMCSA